VAEPVSGDLLLAILERVTARHEDMLEAVQVPPERLAEFHLRRASEFLARIAHPQVRASFVARVQLDLALAVEAEAARRATER
jgi:hypothetical protein